MRRVILLSLMVLAVAPAQAQVVDVVSGYYSIQADAYAGVNSDVETATSSSSADTFGHNVDAAADDNDPIIGGASASSSAGVNWQTNGTIGTSQTLTAQALGGAYAGDFGLSASSNAYATLDLQFTIAYTTSGTALLQSGSTFGEVGKLQFWDGSMWTTLVTANTGAWAGTLNAGTYRFYASDAIGVSGNWSDAFGHDMTLTAMDPVPEPASMLALSLGAAALLRRKRSK